MPSDHTRKVREDARKCSGHPVVAVRAVGSPEFVRVRVAGAVTVRSPMRFSGLSGSNTSVALAGAAAAKLAAARSSAVPLATRARMAAWRTA